VCGCVNSATYHRNIGTTFLWDSAISATNYFGTIGASLNVQHVDTTVPTGTSSTGVSWSASQLGTHVITSNTGWNQTPCNLNPATFASDHSFTAHSMVCKPEWYTGGTPAVNYHAPPSGEIKIVIPSAAFEDARGPAEQAAADWGAALGRTITVQPGYATCVASDPLCIGFLDDHGTRQNDPPGCASFDPATYATNGEWRGTTNIRFEPNWTGGHSDNLQHTIAHELGHYFGLWNRLHSSCAYTDTVMGPVSCYASQAPPTGTALGPTPSDASALLNSTYGTQVRSICGW
jgi:hypothetical protein